MIINVVGIGRLCYYNKFHMNRALAGTEFTTMCEGKGC